MKSEIKLLSLIALFLLLFSLTTVKIEAAEQVLTDTSDLRTAVENAGSGDIIDLGGNALTVNDDNNNSEPWLINKDLTIKNGTIALRSGGIILGGNVTFENIQLDFPNRNRNVIAANGYTLTLTNTTRAKNHDGSNSAQQVHLFAGSMLSANGMVGNVSIPASGPKGIINITGSNVDLGNIYAGHISTDGTSLKNSTIPVEITVNVTNSTIGLTHTANSITVESGIYSSGALQTPDLGGLFDTDYVQLPPIPQSSLPVNADVTININDGTVKKIHGATYGTKGNANIVFTGGQYPIETINFITPGSITVANGKLTPNSTSDLTQTSVNVSGNGRLNFTKLSDIILKDFTGGGGIIVLNPTQTITLEGTVSGQAKVSIGDVDYTGNESTKLPEIDHTYITSTLGSAPDSFSLLPYTIEPAIQLINVDGYNWKAQDSAVAKTYSVTATIDPTDGGSVTGTGTGFSENTPISLVAKPNAGYTFKGWETSSNGVTNSTNSTLTFNMPPNDVTVTAKFEKTSTPTNTYSVTASVDPNGGGTVTGTGTGFSENTPISLTAKANPGYTFKGWEASDIGITSSTNSILTFNMPAKNVTVTARFEKVTTPANTYSVTASINPNGGGTVTGTGTGFSESTHISLVAKANPGYTFKGWEATDVGITSSTNSILTFSMPAKNVTVTARFEKVTTPTNTYSVTASVNPNGGGTVTGAGTGLKENTSISLTAKANSGYTFKGWEASGISITNPTNPTLTFNMPAKNVTVTAKFEKATTPANTYSITASANPAAGGSVMGAGAGFQANTTITLVAKTNPGYAFKGWESPDITVTGSRSPNLTFTMPAKNITVTAKYEQVAASGSQSGSGSQSASSGSSGSSTSTTASGTQKTIFNALTEVPASLRSVHPNVTSLTNAMLTKVTAVNGYSSGNTIFYDVKLQISSDGGKTWKDATEANFPTQGIRVFFSYPQGTGKNTHDFLVTHMFTHTSSRLGTVAGNIEQPPVTKLDNGIQVTLKGLSPVSISWKAIGATTVPRAPKTGDFTSNNTSAQILPWICVGVVSSIALACTGLYFKKK